MKQYNNLLDKILTNGEIVEDRTGVGTIALFGEQIEFDLRDGFPAVTTKKLAWKSVISELLWFMCGSTNVNDLRARLHGEENRFNPAKKTIWDANYEHQGVALGYKNGELGPVYGAQWCKRTDVKLASTTKIVDDLTKRGYTPVGAIKGQDVITVMVNHLDQLNSLIERAKTNPECRRLIVSAWNPSDQPYMTLPPCHYGFQINISGEYIDLLWTQR